jgi:hypothetical protein
MTNPSVREFRAAGVGRARRGFAALIGILAALPVVAVTASWLTAPHQITYEITDGKIVIHAGTSMTEKNKEITLARIEEASPAWLRGGSLDFGTEKHGYCVGFYEYPNYHKVWQATDCSEEGVVIRAGGEVMPIIIAPDNRDAFLAAIRDDLAMTFPTAVKPSGLHWPALVALAVVAWGAAAVLGTLLFLAPGRMRYLVRDGRLEVTTLFGTHAFPLAGASVRVHSPLTGERLSGVNLPGYCAGVMVFDRAPTSVYATVRESGVLLEGDERVFVSPADPPGLIAAAIAAGGREPATSGGS